MCDEETIKRICEKQKACVMKKNFQKDFSEKQKAMSEEPPSKGFLRNRKQLS